LFTKSIKQEGRRVLTNQRLGITSSLIHENYRFAFIQEFKLGPFQEFCVCGQGGRRFLLGVRHTGRFAWGRGELICNPKKGNFKKSILKEEPMTHSRESSENLSIKQEEPIKGSHCLTRVVDA
jgi:hypothetical protein